MTSVLILFLGLGIFAQLPSASAATVYLGTIGVTGVIGSDNAHFFGALGVSVDSGRNIYVADQSNFRIQKFNSAGVYQSTLGVTGVPGSDNAHFDNAVSVAVDSTGNIYVADTSNHRIQKFNSAGVYKSTLGVTNTTGTDNAHFNTPWGVVFDSTGNLYVADTSNHRIQKFNSAGVYQSTLGVTGVPGSDNTHFNNPRGVAFDSSGNIYVADLLNQRVQKFNSAGVYQSTLGVTNTTGTDNAHFNHPVGVAVDSLDNLYVVDEFNYRIQIFNSAGVYQSTLGVTGVPGSDNLHIADPTGVAVDSTGKIYFSDYSNQRVQEFGTPPLTIPSSLSYLSTLGVTGVAGNDTIHFDDPISVASDQSSGNIYVTDDTNQRIQKFNSAGVYQSTLGVTGVAGSDIIHFKFPVGVTVDSSGNIYVADLLNQRVQKFNSAGVYQSTLGVTGVSGPNNAHFNDPFRVAVDSLNNLYVADQGNQRIQKFTSAGGYVSTLGVVGVSGTDNAHFNSLEGVTVDSSGNIYVADTYNQRIQKFNSAGVYQSTLGVTGVTGSDNSHFNFPVGVALDHSGNLYVADEINYRVQIFNSTGAYLSTLGVSGVSGSDNSHFNATFGVTIDPTGNLYVADLINKRVQKFGVPPPTVQSTIPYLSTLGVTGVSGSDNTHFSITQSVKVDSARNIYVVDPNNERVQKFNSAGVYQYTLGVTGNLGNDTSHFFGPNDVAIDSAGNIYVVDVNNQRVQKFNSAGVYQSTLGVTGVSGSDNSHFNIPTGVAVDSTGNVYVTDSNNHRVQKFNSAGVYQSTIGSAGTGNGQFGGLGSISVDSGGNIYVDDKSNLRIEKFNSAGVYQSKLGVTGVSGNDTAHFNQPSSVAVDSTGNIYVCDDNNHRVQIFNSTGVYQSTLGVTGVSGSDNTHFSFPRGVGVDPSGNIYIADGNNFRVQIFGLDTTPPSVSITSPANNTSTGISAVAVSGTASDLSGISSVTWRVDGGPISSATGTTSWSFTTAPLLLGAHSITINATDNTGNSNFPHINIVIIPISSISFDQSSYEIGSSGRLTVTDQSANNPGSIDLIQVKINSTSDGIGFNETLIETGTNTGIFTGTLSFTQSPSIPASKLLHVDSGETAYAYYGGQISYAGIVGIGQGAPSVNPLPISLNPHVDNDGAPVVVKINIPGCHGAPYNMGTSSHITAVSSVTPGGIAFDVPEDSANSCTFTSNGVVLSSQLASSTNSPPALKVGTPTVNSPTSSTFACTNCGVQLNTIATIVPGPITISGTPQVKTNLNCASYGGDTDGDGICNNWEAAANNGVKITGVGSAVYQYSGGSQCPPALNDTSNPANNYPGPNGLAAQCPSPTHKDVFLELDYMTGHKPITAALVDVINAYAQAPVSNSDGKYGINLHILLNEDTRFHDDSIPFNSTNAGCITTTCLHGGFEQIKQAFFGTPSERGTVFPLPQANIDVLTEKRQVFHYGLFIHDITTGDQIGGSLITGTSGYAEVGGNDFLVSLGEFNDQTGDEQQQAGSLMHELGHNLGLNHGGASSDNNNCKPNYLSVMNYMFQFSSSTAGGSVNRPLDYSHNVLPTLDEANLMEASGIGRTVPQGLSTIVGGSNPASNIVYSPLLFPVTNNATIGLAQNSTGFLYSVDSANDRIEVFDSTLAFKWSYGTKGSGTGQFLYPTAIVNDTSNNMYVLDTGNNRIVKLSPTNPPVFTVMTLNFGNANDKLLSPEGIAVNKTGFVFVSDTGHNRVLVFDSTGLLKNKIGSFGSSTTGAVQFSSPRGIAFDTSKNVYVVDSANARIVKLTPSFAYSGTPSGTFGAPVVGTVKFNSPISIARDTLGNFLVIDSGNNRIEILTSSLLYSTTYGTYGSANAQFNSPYGLVLDKTNNIYIGDAANNRIQKLTSDGAFSASSVPILPITLMNDITASSGLSLYSARQIQAEFASQTSQLVGKPLDTIMLNLKKVGSPTGTAQIGVFNTDLSIKKLFGTKDVSTLTTSYADYSFTLPNELYTISSGDYIGIKFTGGDTTNIVGVMTDTNSADPFDGVNSYHAYYDTAWRTFTANDLYMKLLQTNAISFGTGGGQFGSKSPGIDYDRSGVMTSTTISNPIHATGISDCQAPNPSSTRLTLKGYDDWDNIQYAFRTNAGFSDGLFFRNSTEITATSVQQIQSSNLDNAIPVANAGGPYTATKNTPVTLISQSTDPENDIVTTQWDMNNDGHFDGPGDLSGITIHPTFTQAGTFTIGLLVTDSVGLYNQTTTTVHVENIPPPLPITLMNDTTASSGLSTYSARQLHAEYANTTSQLVGKPMDTITLKLKKVGAPTGTAQIGVFNNDLSVKKLFATKDVSTLTGNYTILSFTLPNELYTISSGDYIGIKFTGGNSINNVGVMTDTNPADPFDGTNSFQTYYDTTWRTFTANDMYMKLQQTHPALPFTLMNDTTMSSGLSLYSGRQIHAEFANTTSQLVGKPMDTITLKLKKVGAPTGTAQIGVFNTDLSVKKLFGTKDVSTLTGTYTDYSFTLPNQLYTISSGDRIGIKFSGGNATSNVGVMTDTNPADPFDGTSSYQTYYDTTWKTLTANDLYMKLQQTHSGSTLPITMMNDTTMSSGLSLYSGRQIHAEFANTTSQLVGKPMDTITLKLKKAGSPTGTAQIGVFNTDLSVKKLFGTKDVSTLTGTYTDYSFTLPNQLYTISSGDRIGIKFSGGNATSNVGVMTDTNPADPFDGVNSFHTYYDTTWKSLTANDLYMKLQQTHP